MNRNARRAGAWLLASRDLFDFRRRRGNRQQLQLLKPFSELVLCLSVVARQGTLPKPLRTLLDYAWNAARRDDFVWRLLWARPEFVELLGLFASFHRAGYVDDKLVERLHDMMSVRPGWGVDLPPWRRLAVSHALEELAITSPINLSPESMLHQLPPPWIISDSLAYAATHEIFYMTDFGMRRSRLSSSAIAYLEIALPMWIDVFAEQKNWDLLAELIVSCNCVKLEVPAFAIHLLKSEQAVDGAVKGPRGAGRDIPARGSVERQFVGTYHTTLVSFLAFAGVGMNAVETPA